MNIDRCYLKFLDEKAAGLLRAHRLWKENGILPDSGGMNDQPAIFWAALEVIDSCYGVLKKF